MRYIIRLIRFLIGNPDLWDNRFWSKAQLERAKDTKWIRDLLTED